MQLLHKWGTINNVRPIKLIRKMIDEGCCYDEAKQRFIDLYGVSEEKAGLSIEIIKTQKRLLKDIGSKDACLYIGIPFCRTRCLYCSFITAESGTNKRLIEPFVSCLLREIEETAKIIAENNLNIVSVYFGGGTPTILSANHLTKIIDECKMSFKLPDLKEFTVEAGRPDTLDMEKLFAMKEKGVTRISINPQTMKNATLKAIGRRHFAEDIVSAFKMARESGFDNINADVIAGLPFETLEDFKETLNRLEELSPESVTVHTMSVKRGSKLHEAMGSSFDSYNAQASLTASKMVDHALAFMKSTKRNPYYLYRQKNILGDLENVGYAKEGYECLYNVMIMEEVSNIISLGGGGVTKIISESSSLINRIFNVKEPRDYIERIDEMIERKSLINKYIK